MAPSMWVGVAGSLAVEVVRAVLSDLRHRASAAAIDEAARLISDAVLRLPLEQLPPAQHAAAHAHIAESLIDTVAKLAGLSSKTRKRLHAATGRKLVRGATDELLDNVAELERKQKKWAKALKL